MTTGSQIRAALSSVGGLGNQGWPLDTLAKGADDAMRQAGITTKQGAAVFLAQCMVESAYFRTTREYGGSSARYAPYYGRGFIQVTWKDNYAAFGRWCKARGLVSDANYFVNSPDRLADDRWAWLGAVWYLSTHRDGLIARANRGENKAVGRGIHTGSATTAGYPRNQQERNREDHTMKAYNALIKAGITAPGGAASSAFWTPPKGVMSVKAIQKAVGVTADGLYGNATSLAVREYQKQIGIRGKAVDGKWGPATEAAYIAAGKPKPKKSAPAKKPAAKKSKGAGLVVDGKLGPATYKALQRKVGAKPVDGKFGPASKKALQSYLGVKADGVVGPRTVRALQRKVGASADGIWGPATTRAVQRWLNR